MSCDYILQVFEGIRNRNGSRVPVNRELTKEEKRRRVVLKRVNNDSLGTRSDFLQAGTMAQVGSSLVPVPLKIRFKD